MKLFTAAACLVLFFAVSGCSENKAAGTYDAEKIRFEPARKLNSETLRTEAEVDSLLNSI